jgi:rhamnopyranosyl-N-acetylglucosaminyl-diphospho-decaprenol beta-1,3/1,4-galactofuranosyltransferase
VSSAAQTQTVGAVIVTYNRCELARDALAAVYAQTSPPSTVVVVDNASTDGTAEMVRRDFPHAMLIALTTNVGGAGGFARGMTEVLRAGVDLVWLMDDDAVATADALGALLAVYAAAPRRPALVASRVVDEEGRPHPMNTPRTRPFASRQERLAAAELGCLPIRTASFVSVLLDADSCRALGLPIAAYFLWNDDFEYTARLLRRGVGLLCPDSVVVHRARPVPLHEVPADRLYYEGRNKVWALTRSQAFGPIERFVYAGAAVKRWGVAVADARDRRAVLRGLGSGVLDGLRRRPRNSEAGPGEAADQSRAR